MGYKRLKKNYRGRKKGSIFRDKYSGIPLVSQPGKYRRLDFRDPKIAMDDAEYMRQRFNKAKTRSEKVKIKRAVVSAGNRAYYEMNFGISGTYKGAAMRMVLPTKNPSKTKIQIGSKVKVYNSRTKRYSMMYVVSMDKSYPGHLGLSKVPSGGVSMHAHRGEVKVLKTQPKTPKKIMTYTFKSGIRMVQLTRAEYVKASNRYDKASDTEKKKLYVFRDGVRMVALTRKEYVRASNRFDEGKQTKRETLEWGYGLTITSPDGTKRTYFKEAHYQTGVRAEKEAKKIRGTGVAARVEPAGKGFDVYREDVTRRKQEKPPTKTKSQKTTSNKFKPEKIKTWKVLIEEGGENEFINVRARHFDEARLEAFKKLSNKIDGTGINKIKQIGDNNFRVEYSVDGYPEDVTVHATSKKDAMLTVYDGHVFNDLDDGVGRAYTQKEHKKIFG